MYFKYKNSLILLLIAVFSMVACEEFEDLNQNPNEPTTVSPDVLLTSAIRSSVNTMVTESFLLGNNAAQLTAKTLRTEVDSYNWNAFPTVWEGLYESLTDVYAVEDQAIQSGNEQLQGAAIVMKAWIFSTLTNAYGNIPYSEAIDPNNVTPAYDDQPEIYADLLVELNRAEDLLAGSGSISGDILLNNDASKWRKWANSLRLRLLMTANNQLPDAGTRFAAIVNSGDFISSNEDNVTLTYLNAFPNEFPLIPLKTGDFDAVALSETSLDVMQGYEDPRLMRYARPNNERYDVYRFEFIEPIEIEDPTEADSLTIIGMDTIYFDLDTVRQFTGAVNGSSTANCPKAGSRLGVQYYNYPNLVQASTLGLPIAEGIVMTYAEVEFLLAEAALKGWTDDNAEDHYRAGIQASMNYNLVDYSAFGWSDFDDYYNNSGVAYQEATDIWEQKWLALFFHGLEPYFEVRRWYFESGMSFEGIPFLEAACDNLNNDQLPLRFLYPGEEQSLNAINYDEAIKEIGGSNSQNAIIWLVQ